MDSKVEVLMNWRCNQNCIFCSVGHQLLHGGIVPLKKVKESIEFAKARGAKIISFSGGEPTIRKDLVEAVSFAKKQGFEFIEIQSNGRMYKNEKYVDKLISAGANKFLVSIHSIKPEIEDYMVMVKGACKEQIKGIENLSRKKIGLRINSVITKFNYKDLPETVDFLGNRDLLSYHLDFVAPDGFALDSFNDIAPGLMEAAPFITKAAEIITGKGTTLSLHNLFPCIIPGYEIYMADLTPTDTYLIGPEFEVGLEGNKSKYKIKNNECEKCKWSKICNGPYKKYIEARGFDEFKAVQGKKIEPEKFKPSDYKWN